MSSVSEFPPRHLTAEEGQGEESAKAGEGGDKVLALPAPGEGGDAAAASTLQGSLEDDKGVKFDRLGPMVVNTDGTLSRVHNWAAMTDAEQETTRRVLLKRNKSRLEEIKRREDKIEGDGIDAHHA